MRSINPTQCLHCVLFGQAQRLEFRQHPILGLDACLYRSLLGFLLEIIKLPQPASTALEAVSNTGTALARATPGALCAGGVRLLAQRVGLYSLVVGVEANVGGQP